MILYIKQRNVANTTRGSERLRQYLRELRKQRNLTQQNVADFLKMTKSSYGMIEMGDRQKDMNLSIAVELAKVFEISIDYIIAEEEKLKR